MLLELLIYSQTPILSILLKKYIKPVIIHLLRFKMKLILLKNKNIHKNCKLHQKEIILKPQWVFNK